MTVAMPIPFAAVDDIAGEDTSASANSSKTLQITCGIYFSIMALGWLYFDWARRKHQGAYATRNRSAEYRVPLVEKAYCFMGWIASVIRLSDEEVMEYCGLDTLIFLRFQRLCGKIAACGIFCSIFLFPTYATAPLEKNVDPDSIDILQKLSLGNVMASDPRLYASIFAAWALSLLTMYLVYREYQVYVTLRHEFLQRPEVQQYSVLIHNLPLNLRTNAALKRYMDYLFPQQVRSVVIAIELGPELERLVDERCLIRQELEHAMTLYSKTGIRPQHGASSSTFLSSGCCRKSPKVDSIEWYQTELEKLNDTIALTIRELEQRQLELDPSEHSDISSTTSNMVVGRKPSKKGPKTTATSGVYVEMLDGSEDGISDTDSFVTETTQLLRSSGFVSYTSIQAAQMSQQVLQTSVPNEMDIEPAPAMDDVFWPNVGMPHVLKKSLQGTSTVVTTLIVLFWTIPTAAVVSLSSVSSLKAKIPSLAAAVEAQPWLELVIEQIGPLALVVMNALAPIIFGILSRKEGHCSESTIQASLFTKLCLFELVQIFFVASISGSILDSLSDIIDQPSKAPTFLGASIPSMASFFMGYIVIQTGLTLTLELLRIVPRIVAKVHDLVAPRLTRRERNMPWMGLVPLSFPGPFEQTTTLADHYLVVLLIITYGPISPLVCYFGGLYFFMSDIIFRRQVLFVHDPTPNSFGVYWPKLYQYLIVALVIGQLTMIGVLGLKKSPAVILVVVLPFVTMYFNHWIKNELKFPRIGQYLPLDECTRADRQRQHRDVGAWAFLDEAYVQPAMTQKRPLFPEYTEYEEEDDVVPQLKAESLASNSPVVMIE